MARTLGVITGETTEGYCSAHVTSLLRGIMLQKRITYAQLSEMTGLSDAAIQKIVKGKTTNPGIETLLKIVHALGLSLSDLVTVSTMESAEKVRVVELDQLLSMSSRQEVEILVKSSPISTDLTDVDVVAPLQHELYFSAKVDQRLSDFIRKKQGYNASLMIFSFTQQELKSGQFVLLKRKETSVFAYILKVTGDSFIFEEPLNNDYGCSAALDILAYCVSLKR